MAAPDHRSLVPRLIPSGRVLRRFGALAGVAAAVTLVVWLGSRWGSDPSEPAPAALADRAASAPRTGEPGAVPSGTAEPGVVPSGTVPAPAVGGGAAVVPEEDWAARLAELYQRRAQGLSTGSPALLDGVYAPGSSLLTADRGTVSALAAAGEALRGFAPEVVGATVLDGAAAEGRVTLRVVDRWPAYEVVRSADPGGPALRPVGERGEAEVRMTLVATAEGWRIASAERVA